MSQAQQDRGKLCSQGDFQGGRPPVTARWEKFRHPIAHAWGVRGWVLATVLLSALFGLNSAAVAFATEFYVAPGGSARGNGSGSNPWDLATALAQPPSVRPGDTIWIRGGTYVGAFASNLTGNSGASITVRQYPGERATLDGRGSPGSNPTLAVFGAWTIYRDFEVMNSDPNRPPTRYLRPTAVAVKGPNTKFINMIVHDGGQGFGFWSEAPNSEIYGCLIYYNGGTTFDHGIYVQNQSGGKRIINNIIFNNSGHGIHGYSDSSGYLNNIYAEGNTSFNNGVLLTATPQREILIGGEVVAQNPSIISNYVYGSIIDAGYAAGCTNPVISDNYVYGSTSVNCSNISMTGNTYYGPTTGFSRTLFTANTYLPSRPTGKVVFVRPNAYEFGRANITVYNWDLSNSVSVNLSSVLTVGAVYEIRNAVDYFGTRVASGVFDGNSVQIPLVGLGVTPPVGLLAPLPSGPEFNAFVVLSLAGAAPPPAPTLTPSPAPSPTPTLTPSPAPSPTPTPAPVTPVPTTPPPVRTPSPTPVFTPPVSAPTPPPSATPTPAAPRVTAAPAPGRRVIRTPRPITRSTIGR